MVHIFQYMVFGVLLLYAILNKTMSKKTKIGKLNIKPLIVFLLIMVIVSAVEYLGSLFLEKCFGMELWNYSYDFLNLDGRISLRNSTCLSIGAMFMLYLIWPILEKIHKKIDEDISIILSILIIMVMGIDLIMTVC